MQGKTTHAAITQFLTTLLPPKPNDVPLLYHVPRNPKYDPNTAIVEQIALSVTPTPRVYDLIGYGSSHQTTVGPDAAARAILPRPPRIICFLHRPFDLERRSIRRGALVLSSHTSFDEHLTVGWNTALTKRLGVDTEQSICVKGYKGDPERKIGIVGQVSSSDNAVLDHVEREFGGVEFLEEGSSPGNIGVLAIMNAFSAEEVHHVFDIAHQQGWTDTHHASNMLYITGQPRESGLAAAQELGMTVACIGHQKAEEWGIAYLAVCLRASFRGVDVKEVYEEPQIRT